MCIPGYWLGGFHRTPAPRKLSYPLGWGTLGCAFPQGLGAALAGAGPAVSISGDGGFLYACGELAAAKQEDIPLTAVIVDDGGYGMIRYDQDLHGDPREGVDLTNPDFVALAAVVRHSRRQRGRARRALRRGAEGPRGAEGADDAGGASRPRARRRTCRRAGTGGDRGAPAHLAAAPGAPRRRAHPAAGRAHGAGRRGLARRPAHPPRAASSRWLDRFSRPPWRRPLAWLIATELVGHDQPFFAPISAVVTLGLTVGERRRRAVELAIGVAVGIGDRRPARGRHRHRHLADRRDLRPRDARGHAGGRRAAARVAGRAPRPCWWPRSSRPRDSTSTAPSTPWSAAARALAVGALLLPVDPVRLVREGLGPVLDRLAAVLEAIADALEHRDAARRSGRSSRSAGSMPSTTTSPRRSRRPATPPASRSAVAGAQRARPLRGRRGRGGAGDRERARARARRGAGDRARGRNAAEVIAAHPRARHGRAQARQPARG